MKPTFTPGPWHVVNAGPHYNNKAIDNLQIQYGNDGECISDHVYEVADAHLIAAAPELLEALEMALEWIDAVPPESAASFPVIPGFDRDWVNELVSKARGEIK